MYVSKVDLFEAILIEHRSNAFLDTRAQYCLEFYFQRYEKDSSLALDQLPAFVSSVICHSSVLSFVRQSQSLLKFEVKDEIPRFPSFRYWVSAKVENWETSGMSIFLLKSYHNLFVTFQNLK